MKQFPIDQETKELTEEVVHKQVASLSIAGATVNAISQQLGITRYKVSQIMNSEEYKAHLRELSDNIVNTAASTFKGAMGELIPKAIAVLTRHLEEGNLEGVKILMKAIGVEKGTEQVQQGNIQVILPSFDAPKEVKSEVIE